MKTNQTNGRCRLGLFLPLVIGLLFGTGFFLMMSPRLLRIVFGFLLVSQGANLFIFSVGGLTAGEAPLIPAGSELPVSKAETLSQALILTAIVIGFALTAFLVVLARQAAFAMQTENSDEMRGAEK